MFAEAREQEYDQHLAEFADARDCHCANCRSGGGYENVHGHTHPNCFYYRRVDAQLAERCKRCADNRQDGK